MANTYSAQDGWNLALRLVKGAPIPTAQQVLCADLCSASMYISRPWLCTLKDVPVGTVSLTNGNQDFNTTITAARFTKFSIVRTDVTPNKHIDIDVARDLAVDLQPRSFEIIRAAAYQHTTSQYYFRLEGAISVPTGATIELRGQYQPPHTKIAELVQNLWFDDDKLMEAFCEGLAYWAYKLADDARAGGQQFSEGGKPVYSGQYAAFRAAMSRAAASEDFPNQDNLFPSETLAVGRDNVSAFSIFGW